jgi:hypothetical protein
MSCTRPASRLAEQPPSALPANSPEPGSPRVPWAQKNRAERMEFMGLHFFPRMKALFEAQGPASAPPFRCQTCHGEDMEAVNYRMPNSLYALPAKDPVAAARAYDERTTTFMVESVAKTAVELLGGEKQDDACHLCHQVE